MVGPFIFFDQMGPAEFLIGNGIDVRPHPHIGLATVTYLFEGEVFHRDSLGTSLAIRPGEVNLMTAGRGIVHSERETSEAKAGDAPAVRHPGLGGAAQVARGGGAGLRPSRRGRAAAHRRRGQARAPGHGPGLRRALAGRVPAREPVCRGRAGAGRRAAARSRLRRARGLRGLGRDRHRRRHVRRRAGCWCSSRATASRSWPTRSRG